VPEINLGQLVRLIRGDYLIDAIGFNKVQGRPFKVSEIVERCERLLGAPQAAGEGR
jgi:2-oxoglutarate ferredoxin oxidoreductase subunit alpha